MRISSNKTRTAKFRATASGGHSDTAQQVTLPVKRTTKPKSLRGCLCWGADPSLDRHGRTAWPGSPCRSPSSGRTTIKTFGILQDIREKPDAKHVGVVVRGTKYYP
ncbi:hypothetical protein ACTVCO_12170 [Sanguibacter sp. A247]|uniref:hypothetical protein n=1 Tax=unclassified Sanguibacter TaxID=2645534 RepID=UPI003FD82A52